MLWRWRILAVVMAMVAARVVWGWPPMPRWTVKVQNRERPLSWNYYEKPVGFTADNAVLFTEEDRCEKDANSSSNAGRSQRVSASNKWSVSAGLRALLELVLSFLLVAASRGSSEPGSRARGQPGSGTIPG